ncbi:hypothetical protein N3K66_001669 [Trichothecium roseum]|uniref:Uncharacterized protein n=1 Tax=Trichothecium roseum TaxID=47278 RepID=A0ACC0V8U6_9HYPO|nr:hypothetical protein N3K66_001669 [Trichothecium roseum]
MTLSWEDKKDIIIKLYIDEGKKLTEVQKIMVDYYNFHASIRSYRKQFDNWQVGKYKCTKRQHWGGPSRVKENDANSPTPPPMMMEPPMLIEPPIMAPPMMHRYSQPQPPPPPPPPLQSTISEEQSQQFQRRVIRELWR